MAKIFIASNSMIIGGIENSLISFLNSIDYSSNSVTLLLQERIGKLLNQIPKEVKIIEYKPYVNKNIIIRKIKNRLKFMNFIRKNRNIYDVSICYTSYIYLPAIIVRKICKNNYMWIHTDYTKIYNKRNLDNFIKKQNYHKYKNLVFVSENALRNYMKIYNNINQNCILCRNLLPYEEIIRKSNEKINYQKENKTTFVNISRHDEPAKKISRIIEAASMLKKENIDFKVLLIGKGTDTRYYKNLIKEKELEDCVSVFNEVVNPFPYYKIADCFILTSEYEGGPITIYESLALNTPVITTDVGDVKKFVSKNNGLIISKNIISLYKAMKKVINKNDFKVKFDYDKFNEEILKTINKIIGS